MVKLTARIFGLTPKRARTIVYPRLGDYGRLGNQLFQIAGTLGIAAREGANARFNEWPYRRFFTMPDRFFETEDPEATEATVEEAIAFPVHLVESHRPFLQDASLFLPIRRQLLQYFQPAPALRGPMEGKFAEFLRIPNKTALHVRRTDYLDWPDHLPAASVDYYRQAVASIGESNIAVFSDDVEWCRENLDWARPAVFVEGNEDHEDLFLMSRCRHHIIANSSFSWWGAFLSDDRHPIYPTRWFGPAYLDQGVDPSHMFVKGWIGVDA